MVNILDYGIPPKYQDVTIDSCVKFGSVDSASLTTALTKVTTGSSGVLIVGEPRSGKTALACAIIINFLLEKRVHAYRADFGSLIQETKANYYNIPAKYAQARILCVDEITAGLMTEQSGKTLERLLKWRDENRKVTFVVSNCTKLQLNSIFSDEMLKFFRGEYSLLEMKNG